MTRRQREDDGGDSTLLLSTAASAKNPVQKRTKEKFPVDPVTSSEPALHSKEQIPPPHAEAPLPPSAETENCTAGLCCRAQTEHCACGRREVEMEPSWFLVPGSWFLAGSKTSAFLQ